MILPTIHFNGTSTEDLLQKFENAARLLDEAMDAIQSAAPHGRDYLLQGTEAFSKAQAEHIARLAALSKVHEDIEKLAWHIQDAIYVKQKQRAGL